CFLVAALAKEAAAVLPVLLILFDTTVRRQGDLAWADVIRATWQRQRFVYLSLAIAGIAYLTIRHFALGFFVAPVHEESFFSFSRFQKACFAYLEYWRLCLWPMTGLGPIHTVDEDRFTLLSFASLAIDAAAIAVAAAGMYLYSKRHAAGALILSF